MPKHRLGFLDVDCWVGKFRAPLPKRLQDDALGGLVGTMERLGIAEACPTSASAAMLPAGDENQELAARTAGQAGLHPVWCLAAHHTGEAPSPEETARQMRASGFRIARAVVGEGYFGALHLLQMEGLLDVLAANRVPLVLDLCDRRDIESRELCDLLRSWPELPVILSFPKVEREGRVLFCLLERHRNLRVSLRGYQLLGGVEELVRRFGPGVPVFGSNYPEFTPLQGMLQVVYSGISAEDKRRVAGDNVRELLRGAWRADACRLAS
jgi:hypothetical protein